MNLSAVDAFANQVEQAKVGQVSKAAAIVRQDGLEGHADTRLEPAPLLDADP